MTIADEITRIKTNIANTYVALEAKGAALPAVQNSDNLANCAESITSGTTDDSMKFLVRAVDYDGTVLKSDYLSSGQNFVLPEVPENSRLSFVKWASNVPIVDNTVTTINSDLTIFVQRETSSSLNEFDITLTKVTGLSVTLKMDGTKNWGDGSSDESMTHTYADYGDYTITCNGTSVSSYLFGQTVSSPNQYVKNAFLSSSTTCSSMNTLAYCSNLECCILSNSTAGVIAFTYCYNLKSVIAPENTLGISQNCFQNCFNLSAVFLPNTLNDIRSFAFDNCSSLESITIPESTTTISNAFYNCINLKRFVVPNSVTTMSSGALSNCSTLTFVALSNSMTAVPPSSFSNCYNLETVVIPEGITTINSEALYYCRALTHIELPSSLSSLQGGVFTECCNLRSIEFPNDMSSFNTAGLCQECSSLESINLPSCTTSVASGAFSGCTCLKSIVIPKNVTNIESNAFSGCRRMLECDFTSHETIPTLSNTNAFTNISSLCKIKVPFNLYKDWTASTNWSAYKNYIDGGTPATLNFTGASTNVEIYVDSIKLNETTTNYIGTSANCVYHDTENNIVHFETVSGITEGATINVPVEFPAHNKVSLDTSVSGLNVSFIIEGVKFESTEESGIYSINIANNATIEYQIAGGDDYSDLSGSITVNGEDITETITMTPATWSTFTRPNLTSNGTLGGSSFAVYSPDNYSTSSSYAPYRAVDSSTATTYYWQSTSGTSEKSYILYNPKSLKVSKFIVSYYSSGAAYIAKDITIYGSTDNITYEVIATNAFTSASTSRTITIEPTKGYTYYKIGFIPYISSTTLRVTNIAITATVKA